MGRGPPGHEESSVPLRLTRDFLLTCPAPVLTGCVDQCAELRRVSHTTKRLSVAGVWRVGVQAMGSGTQSTQGAHPSTHIYLIMEQYGVYR
jgi:hypothetical protein